MSPEGDPDAHAISEMFDTVSLGAPHNAVGFVMWRVVHRAPKSGGPALQSLDLTHLQFITLAPVAWLCRTKAVVRQSEVARIGDIHPMQVSNVMKALEQKAMVTRTPSLENWLAKDVSLTPTGLAALRAALPAVVDVQA